MGTVTSILGLKETTHAWRRKAPSVIGMLDLGTVLTESHIILRCLELITQYDSVNVELMAVMDSVIRGRIVPCSQEYPSR
jgi:hypothetical protein